MRVPAYFKAIQGAHRILKTCWNCGDSIPDPAPVCDTCGAEQPSADGSGGGQIKTGDILAQRYEIRGDIGEGLVGHVYRAHDRDVDAQIALRIVNSEWLSDEGSRKQFKSLFRKSRDVLHAGCVKLYEAGTDGARAYVTMEFIGGLSLRKLLDVRLSERRPFKLSEVEPILAQIVSAFEAGHAAGVPHLALTPANILIQPEGLKLTEFGLSALIPPASRQAAAARHRTAAYASPQFLSGETPSPSDDIYSLGAVLFEMISLQTPAPGISPSDVMEEVPDEIDDLIADCLSEDPRQRPTTAGEVLTRWRDALLAAEKVAAPPTPKPVSKPPVPKKAAPPPPPPPPPPAERAASKPLEPPKPAEPPPPAKAEPLPRTEPEPPPRPQTPAPQPPPPAQVPPSAPSAPRPAAPPPAAIPDTWQPPAAKKGPPVALIVAMVAVLAAVGAYFALKGGDEPVPVASSEPVTSVKEEKPTAPPPPAKPEPVKVEETPPAPPAPTASVSISTPEPAAKPPVETKPAKVETAPKPPPPPVPKPEPKAPPKEPEKPKPVAAADPPPPAPSGRCPAGMAFVPGGSFKMGSAADDSARDFAEKTLVPTGVPDFCIDKYESPNQEGSQPRANVTWNDAKSACESEGKRLCSEAEWEKACKGPKETRYPYGDLFNPRACNTRDQSGADRPLAPAGRFNQCTNPYGAFDLSGNLREWTSTAWSEQSGDKVVRGGSHARPDWATRCAYRESFQPSTRDPQIGYRCCK